MKARTLPLLAATLSLLLTGSSLAQVAIYSLDFDEIGDSINFRTYDGGFMVAPLSPGDVDFLLFIDEGAGPQFVRATGLGTWFVAIDGSTQKAVLANAETNGTPIQFITALGNLNATLRVTVTTTDDDTGETSASIVTGQVARTLEGHILTADTTGAGLFNANVGSAGASELTAGLDAVRTNTANNQGFTVTEAVDDLVRSLERVGITQSGLTFDSDETDAAAGGTDAVAGGGGN